MVSVAKQHLLALNRHEAAVAHGHAMGIPRQVLHGPGHFPSLSGFRPAVPHAAAEDHPVDRAQGVHELLPAVCAIQFSPVTLQHQLATAVECVQSVEEQVAKLLRERVQWPCGTAYLLAVLKERTGEPNSCAP